MRGLDSGAEDSDAGVTQLIRDALDQRSLGADDDEIDSELAAEPEEPLAVLGPHRVASAERRDPGIPGCRVQLGELRALGKRPGERVLAPARPDDEDVHGPSLSAVPARLGGPEAGACRHRHRPRGNPRIHASGKTRAGVSRKGAG